MGDGRMDGWTEVLMDGWVGGWIVKCMERWMDRQRGDTLTNVTVGTSQDSANTWSINKCHCLKIGQFNMQIS